MKTIEKVEFVDATKQYGPPDNPEYFRVVFKLSPVPDKTWARSFNAVCEDYYDPTNVNPDEYSEGSDESDCDFSYDINNLEIITAESYSADGIPSLHELLKNLVKQANERYPKLIKKLLEADAKELSEKEKVQQLKKTLKSELN